MAQAGRFFMKRNFLTLFAVFTVLLLSGGCLTENYQETSYYDLAPPKQIKQDHVYIRSVENSSGVGSKLIYRRNDNKLLVDEYNKFILQPDELLKRYLVSTLGGATTGAIPVDLDILRFDADLATKEVYLTVSVKYTKDKVLHNDVWTFNKPIADNNPATIVAADSECAADLAQKLLQL